MRPHFGLWLKTFNVKKKVVHGNQAECGGAMVGKMANVLWLEGSFVETLKGWQSGWFYITKLRDAEWVAPLSFDPDPPCGSPPGRRRACLGVKKGELTGLQTCIQTLADKKLKLVNVVQVMLIRLILPCQQRAFNLWELDQAQLPTWNRGAR